MIGNATGAINKNTLREERNGAGKKKTATKKDIKLITSNGNADELVPGDPIFSLIFSISDTVYSIPYEMITVYKYLCLECVLLLHQFVHTIFTTCKETRIT